MPARSQALAHDVRNPSDVQARPREFVRMSGPHNHPARRRALRFAELAFAYMMLCALHPSSAAERLAENCAR